MKLEGSQCNDLCRSDFCGNLQTLVHPQRSFSWVFNRLLSDVLITVLLQTAVHVECIQATKVWSFYMLWNSKWDWGSRNTCGGSKFGLEGILTERIYLEQQENGDWEHITFKAACACHMLGPKFGYVSDIVCGLQRVEKKNMLSVLKTHTQCSLRLHEHLWWQIMQSTKRKYMKSYSYFGAMIMIFTTPLFTSRKHTEQLCEKNASENWNWLIAKMTTWI